MGGADSRTTVLHRLVRDGKLAQVVTNHLRLKIYTCKSHTMEGLWRRNFYKFQTSTTLGVHKAERSKSCRQHPYLDLDLVEGLSVVHPDDGASHLRDDDHVPEVGLDDVGLLVGRRLLLLLPELLDERHRLPLEAARELPPDAAREQLHQLLVVHVQQLVEVDAAVRVLAESTLLLELSLK